MNGFKMRLFSHLIYIKGDYDKSKNIKRVSKRL